MKKSLIAALCLLSGPAFAWNETKDFRGLHIYETAGDGIQISVVCDPDGAIEPPENHIVITAGGQPRTGEYVIGAADRTFAGTVIDGTLIKSDGKLWTDALAVLSNDSKISVSIDEAEYSLDTGLPLISTCI